MKLVTFHIDALHLFVTNFPSRWIFSAIQSTRYFQSLRRGRPGNEIDDRFVIPQWFSFPLAVALRGRKHGWVSDDQSEKWSLEIFSILFRGAGAGKGGLLHAVEQRYDKTGHLDTFNEVVGDGTLWVVLVATLGNAQWHGIGTDIDKAVALREIFNASQLLASATQNRIGGLLGRIRIDDARKYVAEIAPAVSDLLGQIESLLRPMWETEMKEQVSRHLNHRAGDLLWREKAGWAICLEYADARYAQQIKVRLRGVERNIASGFYVNVSELLSRKHELSSLVSQLRGAVSSTKCKTRTDTVQ